MRAREKWNMKKIFECRRQGRETWMWIWGRESDIDTADLVV